MNKYEKEQILKEYEEYIYKQMQNANKNSPYAETVYYYTQALVNIQKIKQEMKEND